MLQPTEPNDIYKPLMAGEPTAPDDPPSVTISQEELDRLHKVVAEKQATNNDEPDIWCCIAIFACFELLNN
jgi:hypothetical protein